MEIYRVSMSDKCSKTVFVPEIKIRVRYQLKFSKPPAVRYTCSESTDRKLDHEYIQKLISGSSRGELKGHAMVTWPTLENIIQQIFIFLNKYFTFISFLIYQKKIYFRWCSKIYLMYCNMNCFLFPGKKILINIAYINKFL